MEEGELGGFCAVPLVLQAPLAICPQFAQDVVMFRPNLSRSQYLLHLLQGFGNDTLRSVACRMFGNDSMIPEPVDHGLGFPRVLRTSRHLDRSHDATSFLMWWAGARAGSWPGVRAERRIRFPDSPSRDAAGVDTPWLPGGHHGARCGYRHGFHLQSCPETDERPPAACHPQSDSALPP